MAKKMNILPKGKRKLSNTSGIETRLEKKILEILDGIRSLSTAQSKLKTIGQNFEANFLFAIEALIREYFKCWQDT